MKPDRREFLALGVGALAVATLPRALRPGPRLVRRSIPVMGTVAEVAVLHRDEAWAQRGISAAFDELRRVERTMTRFRSDSEIGVVNAAAGGVVPVSTATAEVVGAALAWAAWTDGRFDPCLGASSEAWDVANRHAPPPEELVRRYAARELWRTVEVDRGDVPAIRRHDLDARLDLGGIAKGYAVDRAADALREAGIFDALVNVGGDLIALGADAHGEPWRVGVRSPEDADGVVATLEVSDAAIATSGDYLRYFEHGGHRYHHLIDPATGAPRATPMRSLTVRSATCMDADAAATALYGMATPAIVDFEGRPDAPVRVVHTV